MSRGDEIIKLMHKEEYLSRIQRDVRDRLSQIWATLQSCIDTLDPVPYEAGALLKISSGQIAQSNGNVDRPVDIGAEQLTKFEESWPHTDSFYSSLSKEVIAFADQKGYTLAQLGHSTTDMTKIITQSTTLMGACYGVTTPAAMTEVCQKLCACSTKAVHFAVDSGSI